MWGMVLLMGFGSILDPMRLGISVLLVSRPRPVLTLFAFWLGGMTTGVTVALVMLLVLRDVAASVGRWVTAMSANALVGPLQIGAGVLVLLLGARMAVLVLGSQRIPVPVGDTPVPTPPLGPQSAITRVSGRLREALGGGHLWVAFVVGLGSATPPVETVVVLAAILASGAAVGTQFAAAIAFTLLTLAVIEIPLLTFLIRPARTQAVMQFIQEWVRSRRNAIIAVLCLVMGSALVATGMGVI
jgi:hypothetical protein